MIRRAGRVPAVTGVHEGGVLSWTVSGMLYTDCLVACVRIGNVDDTSQGVAAIKAVLHDETRRGVVRAFIADKFVVVRFFQRELIPMPELQRELASWYGENRDRVCLASDCRGVATGGSRFCDGCREQLQELNGDPV